MRRRSPILLGLALMLWTVALATPVAATKSCPPLPVAQGHACECKVFNYGTTTDTAVTITIYSASEGAVNACGPFAIPAKRGGFCAYFFEGADNCGCQVTGESSLTRVSFSVEPSVGSSAQASVECTK